MGVKLKATKGRVRLSDGTILRPGDKVSEAHIKKGGKKMKDLTEEDTKPKK